ncbi:CAMK family protein kinase [Tritrichomonas foetus]|uniref:non-specific serine/threonine protein kinase n=1 Tax=Tritrichomonas foetus TaxID=1144522 RepID=A0A1J4L5L4_9EUKA|nr:CAMK family protein kinase [Tritrichomonas foetus]|eukprot:OHT17238.1 CAMK family protein kinase [Tritrichomonas foetus]
MLPQSGDEIGNYTFISKLGSGSFATVWLAQHKLIGSKVAIKIIQKSSINSNEAITRFNRECALLKQMDHPFIAELFEIIETETCSFLVMEYAEHGNMLEYVNKNGRLDENKARHYFCQIISALDYIHNEKYVAHRDLKAENVLLDSHDNIRLIDFGLSNVFTRDTPELKTACGSPAYASPEMIQGFPYTKAADMWSAGILLYAMVVGRLPYDDKNITVILQKIVNEEVKYPSFLSLSLIDLLKRLLTKNPDHRITLTRLKEHVWFSQSEYQVVFDFNNIGRVNLYSKQIDPSIVQQLANLGIDIPSLTSSLMSNELNQLTAIYKILKKERMMHQMKDLIQMMVRNSSLMQYQMSPVAVNAQVFTAPIAPFQMMPRPSIPMVHQIYPMGMPMQPQMQVAPPIPPYMKQSTPDLPYPAHINFANMKNCNRRMSRPSIIKQVAPLYPQSPVAAMPI